MTDTSRSGCPINLSLEVLGDKWSLLIIRDMMFGNRRHFRELLTKSEEGISSNILADRLKTLLDERIITREGGPKMWAEFMDELRERHLGVKRRRKAGPSVGERLQAAYEKVAMKRVQP